MNRWKWSVAWIAPILLFGLMGWTGGPQVTADDQAKRETVTQVDGKLIPPASQRFGADDAKEDPDFQRHVLPLMGRLGCNGRACHGSFQGQGGFRLSLFGYDFKTDHEALMAKDSNRVKLDDPEASKIIQKPTLMEPHKGGKRLEIDSWQYRLLTAWVENGAKKNDEPARFERLEVIPNEILMDKPDQKVQLQVIAHWTDGTREDVTCLSRFRTNDDGIADVNEAGVVIGKESGDTHVVAFYDNGVAPVAVIRPVSERYGRNYPIAGTQRTKIDELILAKLSKLGVIPSGVCNDSEFLRRVSLDMVGTLPTPQETQAFLKDNAPDKRSKKIDELLARPTYAAYWATKICDYTGNSQRAFQGNPLGNDVSRKWYEWLEKRLRENVGYDKIAEGMILATSRKADQSYEDYCRQESAYYRDKNADPYAERDSMPLYWARRNIRTPEEKVLGFSYAFLGVRLECAQCHKHPFDQWTQSDFNQFADFFKTFRYGQTRDYAQMQKSLQEKYDIKARNGNELRKEMVKLVDKGEAIPFEELIIDKPQAPPVKVKGKGNDKKNPNRGGRVFSAKLLGDDKVELVNFSDPRAPLMDWLREESNPYFARAFVNRVWANYFNVGIVNPPDDQNLANPPSNQALLDHLVELFIESGYDMKQLHRAITNSDAYQRSWATNETNRLDERNFSRSVVRRMPAEVVLDAIDQATGSTQQLTLAFTSVEDRMIGPKNGLTQIREGYAGTVFGQSKRDTNCDCSRSNEPNLLQAIFMANDERDLLAKIERPNGWIAELTGQARQTTEKDRVAKRDKVIQENKAKKANLGKELDDIENQIAKVTENFRKARAANDKDRAKKLEERLIKLRQNLQVARKALGAAANVSFNNSPTPLKLSNPQEVITQAYLRTLSRLPSEEEIKIAMNYLGEGDQAKGVRDLLWALLNTKEFITNH